jgi:acyl CoA:acetate/3-ketoacid CoA transferase beta subunit
MKKVYPDAASALVGHLKGDMTIMAGGFVKRVVVVMEHASTDGEPKILNQCALPLTGKGVVDLIVTDLSVFTVDGIKSKTEAGFSVALKNAASDAWKGWIHALDHGQRH